MPFILDTSVTMAWCFDDESTDDTEAVLDRLAHDEAIVPGIWQLEVSNVLLTAERRRRISEAQIGRFCELLEQLPVRVDTTRADMTALIAAGRRHDLTSYDAAYLTLAERLAAPLATLDQKLAQASRAAGVSLLIG